MSRETIFVHYYYYYCLTLDRISQGKKNELKSHKVITPLIRAVLPNKTLVQHNSIVALSKNRYPLKQKPALTITTITIVFYTPGSKGSQGLKNQKLKT